jgi:hypothetical protein
MNLAEFWMGVFIEMDINNGFLVDLLAQSSNAYSGLLNATFLSEGG